MRKLFYILSAALVMLAVSLPASSRDSAAGKQGKGAATVEMRVEAGDGRQLAFSVSYCGRSVMSNAPLGMNVDHRLLGKDAQIAGQTTSADGTVTYELRQPDGTRFWLDTRTFGDGMALRYRIPSDGPVCIYGEQTAFVFPSKTKAWYASGPFQYGWLQEYQERATDSIEGQLLAPPATFRLPDGTYAAATEANLSNFHGAVLLGTAPGKVQFGYVDNRGHLETGTITGMPPAKYWHEVVRGVPWIAAPKAGSREIVTPWRVLMLASDLNGLVNNHIIASMSDRPNPELFPQGAHTEWIKPGRASFTWLVEGDNRLSVANHKRYVDGCAKLGIESVVVDDGWELWAQTEPNAGERTKWDFLKELVDYARERGVNIWVWRPSSPRSGNKTDIGLVDPAERTAFMKKCSEIGVKGLKIDFFHTENAFTVNLMENILKDAARAKLMVIFHGVNKPTGDQYTYPNLLAKEAVRGLECVGGETSWAPGPPWPYHNTVLPFTRWLAGPADYTPLNFRNFCPKSVTFGHQLSTIYMFTSPMLIFAADIEDMLACPARKFIEEVPVTWDETVVLPESEIGRIAALARRKGDVWYLTVLNGEKARTLATRLDFLPKGSYSMETAADDGDNRRHIVVRKSRVRSGQTIKMPLMSGGGFVARISRRAK